MSVTSQVSLIDLSKQLPFEITPELKEQICFGETLVVSCGHYEGDLAEDGEESDSDWTCEESTESEVTEQPKEAPAYEVKDFIPDDNQQEDLDNDDDYDYDFHFYFFPDCTKPPPPQNSKTSIVLDAKGVPRINPEVKNKVICTCKKDKTGECPCYIKLPCLCGAKTKATCTCSEVKHVCVCQPQDPKVECTCKGSDVCLCFDGIMYPVCTCGQIEKPCVCHPEKFPKPVCDCEFKPKRKKIKPKIPEIEMLYEEHEGEMYETENYPEGQEIGEGSVETSFEGSVESSEKEPSEKEPCDCQTVIRPVCPCLKGRKCICEGPCICHLEQPCVCEAASDEDIPCDKEEHQFVCTCQKPKSCTCTTEDGVCDCLTVKVCTCKNPENCKCFTTCDCTNPCVCDTAPVEKDECVCLKSPKKPLSELECTCKCKEETAQKLKRVRAGKKGYRWCHQVDPRHTFFDYAYDRHDKIAPKVFEPEKVKIQGLNTGMPIPDVCPVHGVKAPPYEKKVRKPSIDCCSSVGGISICVETLGEDKDKFLIQVVSYSSKEGAKTGSKLVSIVDCNLHTMEENRVEHITKKDLTKERRSYMAICDNGYYNKVTRICGDKRVTKRLYHTFEKAHDLVLEGANIVLLRYFGLRRYKGTVKTDTVMMDGTICESIYVCHGVSQGIVNGVPMYVVKVERHIIEPNGCLHQTLTVLTLRGYIVSHEWADNLYMLHLNPLLPVNPDRDEIEQHAPLRETWREDMQLMSDFLDFKATRISEGGRYVTESGALTGTVRDYLQAILLLRPHDTIHFTRHYFGSVLSALDIPHDEYFDPASKNVRYYFFEQ